MATRISARVKPPVLSERDRHLVSRFSYGVDEATVTSVRRAGSAEKWFAAQLRPESIKDPRGGELLRWYPLLSHSPQQAWAEVKAGRQSSWTYGLALTQYTMARKIVTTRQVREVMADFWGNLLYIPAYEDRSFPWRMHYDTTLRKKALTSYREMLQTLVVHPAMSGWLTNNDNTRRGINENLGRELLELFTVGRPSGYGESDVRDAARLLTGYRVRVFDGYEASYAPEHHWTGPVSILGFRHANASSDGRAAVMALLSYLATHPATAERVARRLCLRFVSDQPSPAIVKAVAGAYLASGSAVGPTLKALRTHPEFLAARRGKLRSPVEDAVGSARAMGLRPLRPRSDRSFAQQFIWMTDSMGQHPLRWPRPDGFPETSDTWTSPARMLRSWQMHYALSANWWKSADLSKHTNKRVLPASWPRRLDELVEHQSRMLLGRKSADPAALKAISTMLGRSASSRYSSASKVSDWDLCVIRGTLLNSPEGMSR